MNPNPDDILIEDIALGLSREGRFSNQGHQRITVAEHSIRVCRRVPSEFAFCALMHDASEYLLKDIPKPLKNLLPEYRVIEGRLMFVISQKFGFTWPLPEKVKQADQVELEIEWRTNMLFGHQDYVYNETSAYDVFIYLFEELKPKEINV
ncbi:MAG: metal-dependent phosphohydrolase [Sphingobacteriaceae bacterium]|nr:MAG: metal-dependent phosphohydrolase [Sphingobacteriaceae bacterium]